MLYRTLRRPMNTPILIQGPEGRDEALLRNVSASGLSLSDAPRLQIGASIEVFFLGVPREASVVWQRGSVTGLAFKVALSAAELSAIHRPAGGLHRARAGGKKGRPLLGFSELR